MTHILLACWYSLSIPMYEPPDEDRHFAVVQQLSRGGDLPVLDPARPAAWFQEGSQAPLYYFLASLAGRLIPGGGDPYVLLLNPHRASAVDAGMFNNNAYIHSPAEAFPGRGPILAFHLARLVSIAAGALTVFCVYRSARLIVPEMPLAAPLAMAFVGFNQMLLVSSASVNNDNLVVGLSALSTWLILLIVQCGFTWQRVILLSVVLALGSLSKLSGLTIYGLAAVALAILWWKRRITFRQLVLAGLALLAGFALIASWWYIRNFQLYGEPTGLSRHIAMVGPRESSYTFTSFLNEMPILRADFWGQIGWLQLFLGPGWFTPLMDILIALAVIGGIGWVVSRIRAKAFDSLLPFGLMGLMVAVMAFSLYNWTRQTPGTLARLLFPAITAIAVMTVVGWITLAKAVRFKPLAVLPMLLIAGVALTAPLTSLIPAFAVPPTVAALPADAIGLDVPFEKIRVVGYRIERRAVRPGEGLPITIYFRGDPDPRNLSLYLTALDGEGNVVGKIDSYPGRGNLPTTTLDPARLYADSYTIPISASAQGPAQFRVEFGWWDFATKARITAPTGTLILRGGTLLPSTPAPTPATSQLVTFSSSALQLNGFTLTGEKQINLSLFWQANTPLYEDFNIFVHMRDANGKLVAQSDHAPRDGLYPTSAWWPNEPFEDRHTLDLSAAPPGTYQIMIGLYRLKDGSRLPASTGGDSLMLSTPIVIR